MGSRSDQLVEIGTESGALKNYRADVAWILGWALNGFWAVFGDELGRAGAGLVIAISIIAWLFRVIEKGKYSEMGVRNIFRPTARHGIS